VLADDVLEYHLGEVGRADRCLDQNEDAEFQESVHDNQDGVEAIRERKRFDEVHRD
jgi:hypothetical protein